MLVWPKKRKNNTLRDISEIMLDILTRLKGGGGGDEEAAAWVVLACSAGDEKLAALAADEAIHRGFPVDYLASLAIRADAHWVLAAVWDKGADPWNMADAIASGSMVSAVKMIVRHDSTKCLNLWLKKFPEKRGEALVLAVEERRDGCVTEAVVGASKADASRAIMELCVKAGSYRDAGEDLKLEDGWNLLIKAGADPYAIGADGNTACHWLATKEGERTWETTPSPSADRPDEIRRLLFGVEVKGPFRMAKKSKCQRLKLQLISSGFYGGLSLPSTVWQT